MFSWKDKTSPVAEEAYQKILSLPMFPQMTDEDLETVVVAPRNALAARRAPATSSR
jgi:dTDP-4-amino-4,6-dideoxygalactose transaminase